MSNLFCDDLSQFPVIQGCGITIDTDKFGGPPDRRVRNKVLQKVFLDADRQPPTMTCFHVTYQAFIGVPMPAPSVFSCMEFVG
ncbi:hypothetical protein [Novacetimonas hansenii]|uniref:hypothetical protein n=1 Tax=Novacetimonas hansenii TaxID=436 RepID=UPI00094F7476|nr:hypothetical protein [Novacetimonas hansenii]